MMWSVVDTLMGGVQMYSIPNCTYTRHSPPYENYHILVNKERDIDGVLIILHELIFWRLGHYKI